MEWKYYKTTTICCVQVNIAEEWNNPSVYFNTLNLTFPPFGKVKLYNIYTGHWLWLTNIILLQLYSDNIFLLLFMQICILHFQKLLLHAIYFKVVVYRNWYTFIRLDKILLMLYRCYTNGITIWRNLWFFCAL